MKRMKISEVTADDLRVYAREYNTDPETLMQFEKNLKIAKAFIKSYTGLTDEQMDEHEDLVAVLLTLSNEMYDNRTFTVETDKLNPFVKTVLDMHSVNLL